MSGAGGIGTKLFVCAPFGMLAEGGLLEEFASRGIQPEISLDGDSLHRYTADDFRRVADRLAAHGLACTMHAPFCDLSPGAADRGIAAATRARLAAAFDLIPLFSPRSIVCHLSYEENKHGWDRRGWLDRAAATFAPLVEKAAASGCPVMFENTYETGPAVHRAFLERMDSPHARFCLDCGHTLAFARTPWQDWLPELAPWLGQLHIHDNPGGMDAHLAPGRGVFDFAGLFAFLRERDLRPIPTLEPHRRDDLDAALEFMAANWPFA